MKHLISWVLFIGLTLNLPAQKWSTPINISQQGGTGAMRPSLCVDKNGTLHCAWEHNILPGRWNIYYSYSVDQGASWSPPVDVIKDNTLWLADPRIIADTNNLLHIVYSYNCANPDSQQIYFVSYDGNSWGEPVKLSEDYPYSHGGRIAVDKNNRIYCFWSSPVNNYSICYKYLENGTWSDLFMPFNDTNFVWIEDVCCDNDNNINCIGQWSSDLYCFKEVYMKYSGSENQWSDLEFVANSCETFGGDIAVDSNGLPHLTWGQQPRENPNYLDSTIYSYYNGTNWEEPEVVTEDPRDQRIVIDKYNQPNIFDSEKNGDSALFVRYIKKSGQWIGDVVDTSASWFIPSQAVSYGKEIYVAFMKCWNGSVDVYLTKCEATFLQYVPEGAPLKFKIFPNPFHTCLTISFEIQTKEDLSINIYSFDGKLIKCLVKESLIPGAYSYSWRPDKSPPGSYSATIYLVRLNFGSNIITRSVLLQK